MPKILRRDPNSYQYYFKFSKRRQFLGGNDPERADFQAEEHIECLICMNQIMWEVDVEGGLVIDQNVNVK